METEERERYAQALKSASVSKAFDRILSICVVIVFLFVAGYVIWQQASYQNDVRGVTKARNEQLNEIQMGQEAVGKATDELKDYIACLKKLPVQPSEELIQTCKSPEI